MPPSRFGSVPWSPYPAAAARQVAKETATLDLLSQGRLTLGVGLGGDSFGAELSKTCEELDDRVRGEVLDESSEILTAAWTPAPERIAAVVTERRRIASGRVRVVSMIDAPAIGTGDHSSAGCNLFP